MPTYHINVDRDDSTPESSFHIERSRRSVESGQVKYHVVIRCGIVTFPAILRGDANGGCIINVPWMDNITGRWHSGAITTPMRHEQDVAMGRSCAMVPGLFIDDERHMAQLNKEAARFYWQSERDVASDRARHASELLNTIDMVAHGN